MTQIYGHNRRIRGEKINGKALQGSSQNIKAFKDLGDLQVQEHFFFPIDYDSVKLTTQNVLNLYESSYIHNCPFSKFQILYGREL